MRRESAQQVASFAARYIEKHKFLAVSSSDLSLTFYEADQNNQNFRLVTHPYHPVHTKTAQLVLCWSDVGDALFSADHEGVIYAWDPEKLKDTGRLQGLQDDGGKKPTEVRIQNVLNDFIGLKL